MSKTWVQHITTKLGITSLTLACLMTSLSSFAATETDSKSTLQITQAVTQLARNNSKEAKGMFESIETLMVSFTRTMDDSKPYRLKMNLLQAHVRMIKKGLLNNRSEMPEFLYSFFNGKLEATQKDLERVDFFYHNPTISKSQEYRNQAIQRIRDRLKWAGWMMMAVKPVVSVLK